MYSATDSTKPRFSKDQTVIEKSGYYPLDSENGLITIYDVFPKDYRDSFAEIESKVERRGGMSGYGPKPREEVCYTISGESLEYSRQKHYTVPYPKHVKDLIPFLLDQIQRQLPVPNLYTQLSSGIDIHYSEKFPKGGSVSAHNDESTEGENWGLIIIINLGQTRWLRVRDNDKSRPYFNAQLRDNSLVCMYGPTFQDKYMHQVDKLPSSSPVSSRISLNIRFTPEPYSPMFADRMYKYYPHLHNKLPPKELVYTDGGESLKLPNIPDESLCILLGTYVRAYPGKKDDILKLIALYPQINYTLLASIVLHIQAQV